MACAFLGELFCQNVLPIMARRPRGRPPRPCHGLRGRAAATSPQWTKVFGEDLLVPTLEISHYKRWGAKRKVQLQEELDDLLRRQGSASLSSKGRLDTSIASVLSLARDAFRKRLADDAVHGGGFRGFGCGWVFPRSAEMYSHPHYLAFLREDGSSDPPELPFRLQSLLSQIRQQLLPFLEDVLEFGLGYEAGQLRETLQMTTAIVHYYPDSTKQETLLTPAAFHCDDSFLTLNLESTSGIHGLLDADHAAPRIRRFRYEDGAEPFAESSTTASTSVMNLFVGGYLQSWSAGRWPSLLHSGSNPSEEDRLSITIFLGIPELHGFIGDHVHTRGEQEQRVYEWLQKAQHMDDWSAKAMFQEIQDMYSRETFPSLRRKWAASGTLSPCRQKHLRAINNARHHCRETSAAETCV